MDVTFQIMEVTVCEKDQEISDVKKINSLFLLFFPPNIRKLAISFEISIIFPFFHLKDLK